MAFKGTKMGSKFKFVKVFEEDEARRLAKEWYDYHKTVKFFHDDQVPEAYTVYQKYYPEITHAFYKILPPTSTKLKRTGWYGRLYVEGNELKRHKDDPHCDHSLTINLDYSINNWPIWVDGEEIRIPVGYGVYYRGCDMEHWREPLEKGWQAQVFFHYKEVE